MAVQKIDKPEWQAFFDWLSQGLLGARAEIEVASLDLGDQIEAGAAEVIGGKIAAVAREARSAQAALG